MAVCRLMSNLKKLGARVWNGFIFLMTGSNGGAAVITAMNLRVLQNAQNILTLLYEESIAVQSMKMSTAGCIGIYNMYLLTYLLHGAESFLRS